MAHPGTGADPGDFPHAVAAAHGAYRAGRTAHEPPDESISGAVTARTLRPHLVRSGFFFALLAVVSIVSFFTWLIALAVAFADANSITGETTGRDFVVTMAYLLLVVQFLVLAAWIVALFLPLREPIAEYGLLTEGRANAAATAYWWIMNAMHGRQAPFAVQYGKARGLPILLLVHGRVGGLIAVRSVGTDLYIGWTMWRARSTVVMIGHLFRDMLHTGLDSDLRAAEGRALRELIHSVTREGVLAAILQPVADEMARRQVDQLPTLDAPTGPGPGPGPGLGQPTPVGGYQQPVQHPTQQYAPQPAAAPHAYAQQSYPEQAYAQPATQPPAQPQAQAPVQPSVHQAATHETPAHQVPAHEVSAYEVSAQPGAAPSGGPPAPSPSGDAPTPSPTWDTPAPSSTSGASLPTWDTTPAPSPTSGVPSPTSGPPSPTSGVPSPTSGPPSPTSGAPAPSGGPPPSPSSGPPSPSSGPPSPSSGPPAPAPSPRPSDGPSAAP
jgi:hypothetical protein